jgi:Telomere resolvase
MSENSEQPASWRAFTKPPSRRAQPEEPVVLDFGARAQDFLKRITPLSADLATRGRTRTLALQKLHRICLAEVRTLKARYTLATVKLALSKYRNAIRAVDPDHLVLRPRKMRSGQRFSYLALEPEETRTLNAAYHERIHRDQSNLIPLDPEAFIQTALELLASDRYLQKGIGLMALTGRRPAEIFFSASFSLPREKLPYPALLFDGQLKTRQAPGTSFEPYLIPVLGDPKKIIQALDTLRDLKSFPSPAAVNTTTGPQLPKYVSAAFGSLDRPWKPGHLRSAYGAICCHMFKPKNQTDDIFLAQILGHKLLGPNASLSVGQSYKDFYISKV